MALVTLKDVLPHAQANGYAVPAFNAVDFNLLRGIIAAAEQEKSPIIVSLGQGQFRLTPPELLAPLAIKMAKEASVPVVLHLDHGKDVETCVRCLRLGFSSVMYDGSHLPFEENVKNSQEVLRIAKHFGASVEVEIGKVGNVETGDEEETATVSEVQAEDQLTNPAQALEFTELADMDALAVAFGTAHGKYVGEPVLDFQRLAEINKIVDKPLVMHGGSGLADSVFREAIACGVSKINYFTGMSADVGEQVKAKLNSNDEVYYHDTILASIEAIQAHVARVINVFGSNNKA